MPLCLKIRETVPSDVGYFLKVNRSYGNSLYQDTSSHLAFKEISLADGFKEMGSSGNKPKIRETSQRSANVKLTTEVQGS